MAISRKPKTSSEQNSVDVEALISKGGSVASETPPPKKTVTQVQLRVPNDLLAQVDTAVKQRPIRTPRHTWFMEAILEKLDREQVS